MEKKKKNQIKRTKIGMIIFTFSCFLGIFLCIIFLIYYLYKIQTPERLRYVKNYNEFTISIDKVPGCTNKIYPLFQYENQIYNGLCIWNVNINYGTMKAPLKMVLEEQYIELKDILKKMGQTNLELNQEKIKQYEYRRSDKEDENYLITVLANPYQNTNLTQITFEPWMEEEKEATMEGKLNIN